PLDGGLILRSFLWSLSGEYTTATRIAAYSGHILGSTFVVCGLFFFVKVGLAGIWFFVIGYSLLSNSRSQLKDVYLKESFKTFKVSDLRLQQLPQVASQVNVKEFLNSYVFGNQDGCYLVVDDSRFVGLITPIQATSVQEHLCSLTPINK